MNQNDDLYESGSYVGQGNPRKKSSGGSFVGGFLAGVGVTALISIMFGILLFMVFAATQYGGRTEKYGEQLSQTQPSEETVQVQEKDPDAFVTDTMEYKLNALAELLKNEFFLDEVTDQQLEDGIFKGLLNSLGDVYSEYYTEEEFQEAMQSSEGVYYGIGCYVGMDSEYKMPKVAGVFKNSPAEEAGLRNNDLIYKVDGEKTSGKTLSEVVREIRGEEFTQVTITLVRDGEQIDAVVTRRRVEAPTVDGEMHENGMGYIKIEEFDDVTTGQFIKAMDDLYAQGMEGLILDLRGNPGGNLDTVVEIARNLLPKGIIVYTEDKANHRETYECKGDKEIQIPMVVLVDMNSASASEILAGAIQDYGKGILVGTKTYGKGIVQSIIPLRDGTALKITTSGYFTPKGRNIHKVGIEPDMVCEFDGEKYYNTDNPVDNQLEKAKEVLAEQMKNKK